MAEVFLSAFLGSLFDKLMSGKLLRFVCPNQVRSKIKAWGKMLEMIQAFLSDAELKQLTNNTVKIWLADLQDLAYDVEDILDELATEALRCKLMAEPHNRSSGFPNLIPPTLTPTAIKFVASMKSKINGITKRFEEISERISKLPLEKINGGKSTVGWQRPPSTCLPIEPAVYGRQKDKDNILEMVSENGSTEANFCAITIFGMGGIGKTTLARLVYNDEAVQDFNPKAWVCVSEADFDVLKTSKAILESITYTSCDLNTLSQVQIQLKNALNKRKFLIVLDDVWGMDYDSWEILKSPFKTGATGSKIIITTRNEKVAAAKDRGKLCYRLQLLCDDDCWSLFLRHAFASEYVSQHKKLGVIREKVVERCGGLPLTARTLGGLVRCKKDDEWEDIFNSDIWDLRGDVGDLSYKVDYILPALRLSYYHLPSHLKRCFAYCAIFPKNYEFEEKELILLWMAEGLIVESEDKKQIEDLGGEYFYDLVSRSFFQPSNNNNLKFVMHDLVNDLALWVSSKTSFRLGDEIRASKQFQDDLVLNDRHPWGYNFSIFRLEDEVRAHEKKLFRDARYCSYNCGYYDDKTKLKILYENKRLRTFLPLLSYDDTRFITNTGLSGLLSKLKKLRVLSLRRYYIFKLPDSISGLKHLRYLNLSGSMIRSLPSSTASLFNLQTLLLRNCYHLIELPSNMRNLIHLRHLDISRVYLLREMPLGMKELKFLQTLTNFVVSRNGSGLQDLMSLKFLRGGLYISKLENATHFSDFILSDIKGLEVLQLEWGCQFDELRNELEEEKVLDMLQPCMKLKELTIKCYGGTRFPYWIGDASYSNMVCLSLERCEKCTSLPPLGLLVSLKVLTVTGMVGLKRIGSEFYGEGCLKFFPSLETLCFGDMQEWEHWEHTESDQNVESFSCLCKLSIDRCPKLSERLPDHLPSLKKLVIRKCAQFVVSFSGLPKLCELEIDGCKEIVCSQPTDIDSVKSIGLSNISSFGNCLMQKFHNLERLKITGREELVFLCQNDSYPERLERRQHSFTSLAELTIGNCPILVSFPQACFVPVLRVLKIENCNALTSLPTGMERIQVLEIEVVIL